MPSKITNSKIQVQINFNFRLPQNDFTDGDVANGLQTDSRKLSKIVAHWVNPSIHNAEK